jgi:hypothetical protein
MHGLFTTWSDGLRFRSTFFFKDRECSVITMTSPLSLPIAPPASVCFSFKNFYLGKPAHGWFAGDLEEDRWKTETIMDYVLCG